MRTIETEEGIHMYRFTEEQEELYRQTNTDFYNKSLATAGMKLYFETDSTSLFMRVNITSGSSREYFSIDVKVNGKPVGYLDNYSDVALSQDYTKIKLPQGEFTKMFRLGEGFTICEALLTAAKSKPFLLFLMKFSVLPRLQ